MGAESLSTGLPNGAVIERDANGDLTEGDPDPGVPGPICFTSGTYLDTPSGPRLVENLAIDDKVLTLDGGAMPMRWIGCRRVKATGKSAPVVIPANLLGQHQAIRVSQLHRILVRDTMAMLILAGSSF